MSSDKIVLSAEKREITGKKVRSMRHNGKIPATVYQKGKESFNIAVDYIPFTKVWAVAGSAQPVELTVGEETHLTMIKDVHLDPAKNTVMHVAFHAVRRDRKVEAEVPIHIEGDVPAEQAGNFIVRPNDHVLVKALPSDLPEKLVVSALSLEKPGDKLTVADIQSVAGDFEILSEPETILASVEEPRAVEEPEEPEEEVDSADVPSDNGGEDEDSKEGDDKKPEEKPEANKK